MVTFDLETSRSTYEGCPQTSLSGISREKKKTGFCRLLSRNSRLVSPRSRHSSNFKKIGDDSPAERNSRLLLSGSPVYNCGVTRDLRGSVRGERFGCFVTKSSTLSSSRTSKSLQKRCHESFLFSVYSIIRSVCIFRD